MSERDLTRMLSRIRSVDENDRAELVNQIMEAVYEELKARACKLMNGQRSNHTLQPTILVHQAYLKIFTGVPMEFQDRHHFLATVAKAMRQILVDYAKFKNRAKRKEEQAQLDPVIAEFEARSFDLLALDMALERLEELDSRAATAIEAQFFGGMTVKEIASMENVSEKTIQRELKMAKRFLRDQIQ